MGTRHSLKWSTFGPIAHDDQWKTEMIKSFDGKINPFIRYKVRYNEVIVIDLRRKTKGSCIDWGMNDSGLALIILFNSTGCYGRVGDKVIDAAAALLIP